MDERFHRLQTDHRNSVNFAVICAAHAQAHHAQTALTMPSVQPSSLFVGYIAPHAPLYVLPPLFLQSNLYALPPTDLSYHPNVSNSQIHSTFEVGETSAHSTITRQPLAVPIPWSIMTWLNMWGLTNTLSKKSLTMVASAFLIYPQANKLWYPYKGSPQIKFWIVC